MSNKGSSFVLLKVGRRCRSFALAFFPRFSQVIDVLALVMHSCLTPLSPHTVKTKSKILVARLKSISKCAKCEERGHWHRECPKPPRAGSLEPSCTEG